MITAGYQGEALDESGQYFAQQSVATSTALAILVSGMAQAAEQYEEDPETAVATMRSTLERFASDIETLGDEALTAEVEFANQLLQLMEQGAEQGDLYGYGYEYY